MKQVWIDSDAGFDDLLAIQMVSKSPEYTIDGLSLVAGNSELPQVIDNARHMAATFDWQFPLFAGAPEPLLQELITAGDVLGPRGMHTKNRWFDDNCVDLNLQNAVDAMASWLTTLEKPASILALGPMTNLAWLFRQYPQTKEMIHELVFMGGSTDRGNSTAVAEFNFYVDPEAASEVLCSGVALSMIGINACRQVLVLPADVATILSGNHQHKDLLADLLSGYLSIREPEQQQPMPLFDPTAAAALLMPDYLTWQPANVAVELNGELTRGMSVCEFRVPQKARQNARVAMAANEAGIRRLLFSSFGVELS
jgi:purine nucleosidase